MAVRIISAVVAIPLLLFFIIAGGTPLLVAVALLSLIGMYELYKAVSGKIKAVHFVGFGLELAYSLLSYHFKAADIWHKLNSPKLTLFVLSMAGLIVLAMLLIMTILVFKHNTNSIVDGSITLFGFFYVGVLLSFICYIRTEGLIYAWLPFIFAFASDTSAYFVGSAIGKHKLAPVLSPKKSVEGAIGGVAGGAIFTFVYFMVCHKIYADVTINEVLLFTVISGFGSAFSQIGDLAASSIKRFTGIKDYGKLMPGHGGVLDRFDSVLFTLPVVMVTLICCVWIYN